MRILCIRGEDFIACRSVCHYSGLIGLDAVILSVYGLSYTDKIAKVLACYRLCFTLNLLFKTAIQILLIFELMYFGPNLIVSRHLVYAHEYG